ncbi:transposable element Tcb2 transposase [Trichonephila clavipes]|nr:transposable element Tcb2 transposase [Trichonephila clavipes]
MLLGLFKAYWIWNRFLETGSAGRRLRQGRRWATTPNEDRYIELTARRHRNMNATLLQQHLRLATGTTVSTQTVRNRLHGVGLYARRSMAYFHLEGPGSRNNPAFVHKSVRFGGGVDFVDEIFRTIVVPYAAAIGGDFILMDDNCTPHRANLVEDFVFEEGIVRMEWPACSPDINPIEKVWGSLGRRVAWRQPPPQTLQELERALLEEWDRIPQLVINSLIDSMPQRNEKVSNHGSIPITIDCNVVAFIVFEEGFQQPIKRTKHNGGAIDLPRSAWEDPLKWLKEYDRVANFNKWDDMMCLANVYFFLDGTARQWYVNNEDALDSLGSV